MALPTSSPQRCPTHAPTSPPPPSHPFQAVPQPYTCRRCGAQDGTDADRATHYCPCCGTQLASCIRGGSASCTHCGPVDRNGHFTTPVDHMGDLLAGRAAPTEEEQAAALLRARLGDQIAHHVHLDYQRRTAPTAAH